MIGAPAVQEFEAERARLRGLAYRMLGSVADAEDVVQETFLRWQAADRAAIASPRAWLVTACTRLAIDELRAARRRRETYVGPWLPEPIVEERGGPPAGLMAELGESLTTAFLLLLERLAPVERAAFLLHEVLDVPHAEVAATLGKTEAATRQIVSRARRKLAGAPARPATAPADQARRAEVFFAALRAENVPGLLALLAADAEVWSDGGGRVASATRVVRGAARVARFLVGVVRKQPSALGPRPVLVNGRAGVVIASLDRVFATVSLDLDAAGRVATVFIVRNPDKLRRVPPRP